MTTTPDERSADDVDGEGIQRDLLAFLEERTKLQWAPDVDLFESRELSSMFAMELVVFLEQRFGVEIVGSDLNLANFRTVLLMVDLVRRLRLARAEQTGV
ncbi:acyl carrier protein [Amycolatopsis sp. CA-230715]|uniref:acyl carrier protein n=1 Tax=Amycolatopsis sp. CA-230715 TaxID=2745196 RepID=UPI001C334881|nr:acyl carrier protein [Amycolatopsis sp. CA-230715]QWF84527.1 hypothetical protein HUW46_07977 [Amycolatopsis sp. CA-230715]